MDDEDKRKLREYAERLAAEGGAASPDNFAVVRGFIALMRHRGVHAVCLLVESRDVSIVSPFTDEFTEALLKKLADAEWADEGVLIKSVAPEDKPS